MLRVGGLPGRRSGGSIKSLLKGGFTNFPTALGERARLYPDPQSSSPSPPLPLGQAFELSFPSSQGDPPSPPSAAACHLDPLPGSNRPRRAASETGDSGMTTPRPSPSALRVLYTGACAPPSPKARVYLPHTPPCLKGPPTGAFLAFLA